MKLVLLSLFFFSSRRRHTRYIGDWSSDVCSSDLIGIRQQILGGSAAETEPFFISVAAPVAPVAGEPEAFGNAPHVGDGIIRIAHPRSEERRVGKECRSWRST